MSDRADLAIVGGGAAGLAAAIFAGQVAAEANKQLAIVVLDGAARLGAKILVSGGGRCNVTHDQVRADDFHGPRPIIRNVLRHFDEQATMAWFAAMGVALKREPTGKLFPVSDSACTVLDALLNRCGQLGVELRTNHRVTAVRRVAEVFHVHASKACIVAPRLILATGGRSLARTGSDGAGWTIARDLGHTVTPTWPALAPLVLDAAFFHAAISGASHRAELATFVDGRCVDRRAGDLLWTHFGVSGPVVMDASRFWLGAAAAGRRAELRCSCLPGVGFEALDRELIAAGTASPRRTLASMLESRLPRRVVEALIRFAGVDPSAPIGQLPRDARRAVVHRLTDLPLPVLRDRGWNYAEVTAGGLPLNEVDHRTMESRRVPGLHLVGEMLDVDGRIGGFNFQWAWSTGFVAGRAAARALFAADRGGLGATACDHAGDTPASPTAAGPS